MRWLAYVGLLLGLVAAGLCIYLQSRTEAHPLASAQIREETPVTAPPAFQGKYPGGGTITVEAEGLPDEVKAALADHFREVIGNAIADVVNKTFEEFFAKLGETDAVDHAALGGLDLFRDPADGTDEITNDSFSILVIRAGANRAPQTVMLIKDGRQFLRFTRVYTAVDHPLAVMTRTRVRDGHPIIEEIYLEHDRVTGWKAIRSKEPPATVGK